MSRDLQQQRDQDAEIQRGADVDVDAEHNPEVARRASNAGLRRQVQMKGGNASPDTAQVHDAAARGTAGPGAALPHLDTIQRAFGAHDISDIRAHVGGGAAQASTAMGAEAYATGNQIAFAAQPDLHTAAHEAAHVVQQRQGVSLSGGVGQEGDAHEKQADAIADQVVAGKSVEHMLGAPSTNAAPAAGQAVQRKPAEKPVNKAEAKSKAEIASDFGAQSSLKHLAVQIHDWGNEVHEMYGKGPAEGSGYEIYAQRVEAILSSMETQVDMAQDAISAVPKGAERSVMAKDVQAVQYAWNRFDMIPVPKLTDILSKAGRNKPNLSGIKSTIDGFTQQIGYDPADLPLTDVKVDGDEKSNAKQMMDAEVSALAAALDSVKAGNDDDARRVNIHARYLDNVGRDEPAALKSHHAQLKKLNAELEAIRKDKPTLDLGEAHGHLAKLAR